MLHIKSHKQQQLFDPWANLSPKEGEFEISLGPGCFKEHILNELPVREFSAFFNSDFDRPIKELHNVLGVLVLQQTHDLTDEQTVDQPSFKIQWLPLAHWGGSHHERIRPANECQATQGPRL